MERERLAADRANGPSVIGSRVPWSISVLTLVAITAVSWVLDEDRRVRAIIFGCLAPIFLGAAGGVLVGLVRRNRWVAPGLALLLGLIEPVCTVRDWLHREEIDRKLQWFLPVIEDEVATIVRGYDAIRAADVLHAAAIDPGELDRQREAVDRLFGYCRISQDHMFFADYYRSWLESQGRKPSSETRDYPWWFLRLPAASRLYSLVVALKTALEAEQRLLTLLIDHPTAWRRDADGEIESDVEPGMAMDRVREAQQNASASRAELEPLLARYHETRR